MGSKSLVVVLDNVRSALNVGSVFRTCDAFAVKKIVLCGITARPPHREISKTALGAEQCVDWAYEQNTLDVVHSLKEKGCFILSAEECDSSVDLSELSLEMSNDIVLVFGNEVSGVQEAVLDASHKVVQIPQRGLKQSLNVSVAAGIVMWQVSNLR